MKYALAPIGLLITIALSSCDRSPTSSFGFALPQGDIASGELLFTVYGCNSCHEVAERPDLRAGLDPEMTIALGGRTTRIKTHGELVTSVINPSHRLARGYPIGDIAEGGSSRMRVYNDVLTVSELIDLVAFVQDQYELEPYSTYPYPEYMYR